MNKKLFVLPLLAFSLVSCGTKTSEETKSETSTPKTSTSVSSTQAETVKSIYEHQFVYLAPGKQYDATTKTEGEDNTLVEQSFSGKHGGPNYGVFLNLLKDGNKVEMGRKLLYYSGNYLGMDVFKVEGATWSKEGSEYKVNIPALDSKSKFGHYVADATAVTSQDGKIEWHYKSVKEDGSDDKVYDISLNTQKSFAGEYQGTYKNTEGDEDPLEEVMVEAKADGTYTISGSVEDSGLSSFTGTIDAYGRATVETPRLGGAGKGFFFTDVDGKVKFNINMEARGRKSVLKGTIIA